MDYPEICLEYQSEKILILSVTATEEVEIICFNQDKTLVERTKIDTWTDGLTKYDLEMEVRCLMSSLNYTEETKDKEVNKLKDHSFYKLLDDSTDVCDTFESNIINKVNNVISKIEKLHQSNKETLDDLYAKPYEINCEPEESFEQGYNNALEQCLLLIKNILKTN